MKTKEKKYSWKEVLSLAGAIILGSVLVIASIGKVLDPVLFVEQIRKEGLEILFSANTVALIALAIETILGMALLLGVRTFWIVFPSTGLSAFFLFLTGRSYWYVLSGARDNSYDCGCFGVFMQRTVGEAFWQDVSLLVIPLAFIFLGTRHKSFQLPPVRTTIALLSGAAICLWAVFVVGMPPSIPGIEYQAEDSGFNREEGLDIYQPSDMYSLLCEGEAVADTSILESQVSLRLLLVSEKLDTPIILDIRSSRIFRVNSSELQEKPGETIAIPEELALEEQGEFKVDNGGLSFDLDGKSFSLISK